MRLKLWGVRGSIPVPGPGCDAYGGNTSCVQVTAGDGTELILDAGTGIRQLGPELVSRCANLHILLTHLHLDHIQGLMFFAPFFNPATEITVWGPPAAGQKLRSRLARYISTPLSPIEIRELPAKVTFRDLIFDPRLGGGIRDDNNLKVIIPGGASSPWIGPEHLDVSLSNEAIAGIGSMAGSGSVIPMDHTTCMVRAAWRIVRFFHRESCGQCTPCREGGGWLEKVLERIEAGRGREADLDLLMDICDNISPGVAWPPAQTTICVLGPSMPPSVAAGLRMFRDEYLAHIRDGRCPFPPDRLPRRLARV